MDINQSTYNLDFFNFTAEQISAERDHLIKSLLVKAIDSTINKIETPATSTLLSENKHAVVCLMQNACQVNLDCLRELDKKIFTVPGHVLQIKDFELEHQHTSAEEQAKATQLEELKLHYRENMAMLAELDAEQENYAAIEPLIQKELEVHNLIYDICANSDFKNIHKFATHVAKDEQLL